MTHPYQALPAHAFWHSAVAETGVLGLEQLWQPKFPIDADTPIATAGSCFAQHIGPALDARGYRWLQTEPTPPWLREAGAQRFNYGVFSCRTGNIYTPHMLLQWLRLAFEGGDTELWQANGRWYDPLRPCIEPEGFASKSELLDARAATLAGLRRAVRDAHVFVFTLGRTESWRNRQSGLEYALCPGTVAGAAFDPQAHEFHNAGYDALHADIAAALALMRAQTPELRVVLTVSPVPPVASASGQHVLTATSHAKALLRAVAGAVAAQDPAVDYFPAYEILTQPVARGMFFAPDMRRVVPEGVALVMRHFFAEQARVFGPPAPKKAEKSGRGRRKAAGRQMELICEEALLDAFAK
jgi:hypothetical protein